MSLYRQTFKILLLLSIIFISSCTPSSIIDSVANTPSQAGNEAPSIRTEEIDIENEEDKQFEAEIPGGLIIEFWHPWSGETAELVEDIVDQFNQSNQQSLKVIVSSHADKDVMIGDVTQSFIDNDAIPEIIVSTSQSLFTWFEEGYSIRDLNYYISLDSQETEKTHFQDIYPLFMNIDLVNGKRIGLPAFQSGHFLFYNQTWGTELGFDEYPMDIAAFSDQACAAARNNTYDSKQENDGTGGWIFSNRALSMLSWLRGFGGGELINSRTQPVLVEPGNLEAITFLVDLYFDDCAWRGREAQPFTYFSNRFALFYSGQMEDIQEQIQSDMRNKSTDKWIMIPYPSEDQKPILLIEGLSYAITTGDDDLALAAWEFINWMLQPEIQAQFIEKTGGFPLSNDVVDAVDTQMPFYSIWKESIQYLPFAQAEPSIDDWYVLKKILEDIGWQMSRYNMNTDEIEALLYDAENLARGFDE